MEKYDNLGLVGEGSYGMVLKCRHKESQQIVAVKKFIESEDDVMVKKIAMREIRMLKLLQHENLVNLLEVFRRKRRVYLVFEFVDKTVLDDLEKFPDGLEMLTVKKITFQVLRGLEFCHSHNVIHRDVKPENILVSNSGIVKLCDFGFARTLVTGPGEVFTDYVATRWYRSPELLVGDLNYGKAVDIWAVGCLLFEMLTGDPLFPGDSDIDQLFHIVRHLGNLTPHHQEIFQKNPLFIGMRLPFIKKIEHLWSKFPQITPQAIDLMKKALHLDATKRPSCLEMLKHDIFQEGNFASNFIETLKQIIHKETTSNPLLRTLASQRDKTLNNSVLREKSKTKIKKEHKDVLKKSINESKKKKDPKIIPKHQSQPNVHRLNPSVLYGNENLRSYDDSVSNKTNLDPNIFRRNINSSLDKKEKEKESLQTREPDSFNKSSDLDRPETKIVVRTPLDMSINTLGKNLPELNVSSGSRGHIFDTKKHKNLYSKKTLNTIDSNSLCILSDKINEKNKTDDSIFIDKSRKENNKDNSECDLPKVSGGLTLPSVKGAEAKNHRTSPGKDPRASHIATIPHIQNIDLFSSSMSMNSVYREKGHEIVDVKDAVPNLGRKKILNLFFHLKNEKEKYHFP